MYKQYYRHYTDIYKKNNFLCLSWLQQFQMTILRFWLTRLIEKSQRKPQIFEHKWTNVPATNDSLDRQYCKLYTKTRWYSVSKIKLLSLSSDIKVKDVCINLKLVINAYKAL